MKQTRFIDANKTLNDFKTEVWVICPSCKRKAITKIDHDLRIARLLCAHCSYNREVSTETNLLGMKANLLISANAYFGAALWLQHPFKNDIFWAYNNMHLDYLEQYIAATLREHKERSHFTLLEKLPKFYHEAKNRSALLKIIQKLRVK